MKKLVFLFCVVNFQLATAQNVGIGTGTPLARLHVIDSSVVFSAVGTVSAMPGNTPINGEGRRMMWYADKAAFRAGYVSFVNWDRDNIGNYSFAAGLDTRAEGSGSTALGAYTHAAALHTTAFGYLTQASVEGATAMGYNTLAVGLAATAMGKGSIASANYATAMGFETTASGLSSTSMGENTMATGLYSTAMGINTLASSYNTTAMGGGTIASGYSSAAMGHYTMAKALGSFSMGVLNDISDTPDEFTPEPGDRLFQIGNGTDEFSRSNAFTVLRNGNTGIGMTNPDFPLSFSQALGDKISLWSNSANSYGFGIQGALLQIYTDVWDANIAFGYGRSNLFYERMRIINAGEFGLEISGRVMLKNGTDPLDPDSSPGIWLQNSDNSGTLGFFGTQNNQNIGFYGGTGGWGFTYDAVHSRVGIGNSSPFHPLDVIGNTTRAGNFINTNTSASSNGVFASCSTSPGNGTGVYGQGGYVGVYGVSIETGTGSRHGVVGYGYLGTLNYGVQGIAYSLSGTTATGVYGEAAGAGTNWAGYFPGTVFATTFQTSDRKLKKDIQPITGALSIILQLNPAIYTYKTTEFKQMHLPEGMHYGLIADEVLEVMPDIVKKAVQPAKYEDDNEQDGKKLSDEVEFNTVNYTELIPILVSALKEQQNQIESQQNQIDELKLMVAKLVQK